MDPSAKISVWFIAPWETSNQCLPEFLQQAGIELAIENVVKLTLIDYTYQGPFVGVYTASSAIAVERMKMYELPVAKSEYGSQEDNLVENQ